MQRCVISPNLDTLTIANNLQRDVEFHCQCMDNDGMMITGTRWFHNGTAVTIQNAVNSSINDPYQINTTPVTLYINAPMNTSRTNYIGTYTCSPNNNMSSGDTITLNAANSE